MKLTAIIIDPSNFIHMQERPARRRVTIELTPLQSRQLELKTVGSIGGHEIKEEYGEIILEKDGD